MIECRGLNSESERMSTRPHFPTVKLAGLFVAMLFVQVTRTHCAEFHPDIEYGTAGESLRLDAQVPDGDGPFPVAILIHGGGWGGGDKAEVHVPPTSPFTDANFTWFSIDYRLAPEHRWPACIDDVRTAIRWVKAHAPEYKGDPERITLVGYSAGGQLAAFAAATAEEDARVQALVVLAGPTDLVADCERRGEVSPALQALFDRGPEIDDEARTILRDASPLNYLTAASPPTLLVHGTVDESVPYSQSVNYQARLQELGVPCELITIPGGSHRLREWKRRDASFESRMIDWLEATLNRPR
jgi:acetyl esterase/lipase